MFRVQYLILPTKIFRMRRKVGSTALNSRSSRSHFVFTLQIKSDTTVSCLVDGWLVENLVE